jgi:hypothetical protein
MNLPPFPVLPLTPEERILWIDWGERVAAAERERAAKVCDAISEAISNGDHQPIHGGSAGPALDCAAAIRKGNQQEGK